MERNGKAENGTEGLLNGRRLAQGESRGRWEAGGTGWEGGCKRERAGPEKEQRWRLEEALPPLRQEEAKGRLSGPKGKQSPGKGQGRQGPGVDEGRGSQDKTPGRQAPRSKEEGTTSSGDKQPTWGQRVKGDEEGAGNGVIRGGGAQSQDAGSDDATGKEDQG